MLIFSIIFFLDFVHLYVNLSHFCHADSFESKNKKDNDNCESLVRRFADLEMSKKKIPLFRIYKDHLNKMNNKKRIGYVDSEDREKTVSISLCSFANNNSALSQSKCGLTSRFRQNFEEYSIVNAMQKNNTVSIK